MPCAVRTATQCAAVLPLRADSSERQTGPELERAAGKRRAGDLPDRRTSDAGVRNAEAGVIEGVGRIKSELKLTALQFRNLQGLPVREANAGKPRGSKDVPAALAV